MTSTTLQRSGGGRRAERGLVLLLALIVMAAMSLAAVALVRSVDATTTVAGNLALRQAALLPANLAVEEASAALFDDDAPTGMASIIDKSADLPAQNYFASLQAGADARGIPLRLQKKANFNLPRVLYADADRYFEVRYLIERTCLGAGAATAGNCAVIPPEQNPGATVGDTAPLAPPPTPYYRLTVRVDGPSNTTAFLQAMLR